MNLHFLMELMCCRLNYKPTLKKKDKVKPVVLNGVKLDLNGILIEVSNLKRKTPAFFRASDGSTSSNSAVLVAPALSHSLSVQRRCTAYLYWKTTKFLQHFHIWLISVANRGAASCISYCFAFLNCSSQVDSSDFDANLKTLDFSKFLVPTVCFV